eukprot:CAMPEP_0172531850 /NCGR_PEP_ID=MMETSP1067-20121228/5091_1 /TAXON_ID=265564 ORGANISM="Thalassiosira punctigera, Strain Tpunct2005C2" /NCGR_SAMPLE_ID=MMETSP1067 /ASSEMBLY_ACC=CAM_ASM_000444 /LENGTH=608 /DNA_ID=CAMNT_0013316285 /DNA_START=117 /DNA_END=1943 /DNA_ORIENTATION=+
MDEITDTVGGLSLNAKEWRPGQGLSTTPKAKASATSSGTAAAAGMGAARQTSAESDERSARGWSDAVSDRSTSWGDPSSQGIDVKGTHYFGSAPSTSWESSRLHLHTSAAQSSLNSNTSHIHTTFPSYHHQQHRNPHRATLGNSLSLPMEEYHHYRELSLQSACEMEPNDPRHKAVPPSFCRAYCLDSRHENDTTSNNTITQQRSSFGYPTSVFRVTSTTDGEFVLFTANRLSSLRLAQNRTNCHAPMVVQREWTGEAHFQRRVRPPGRGAVVQVLPEPEGGFLCAPIPRRGCDAARALFQQRAGSGGAVAGIPDLVMPRSTGISDTSGARKQFGGEDFAVKSHLMQQENIMSVASSGPYGLPKLRLRINCIGIIDVLEFEARKGLEELQNADMRALGCILLSMTTGTEISVSDIYRNNTVQQQAQILVDYFQFVQQNYSRELYMLVHSLLNPNAPPSSIRAIASSMAMRAFDELDSANGSIDEHSTALMGIYESGRALRLLLKLAYINERPEFGIDTHWSESGDCYILKLFRDFVFHQADDRGRPVMDVGHVVSSLNKLDAADEEKIVLTSRDGRNILVVSFADVAWCLEKAYQELCSNSVPIPSMT